MYDDVVGINEHPVAVFLALGLVTNLQVILETVGELIAKCQYMTFGTTRGDHHIIGNRRLSSKVNVDDIFGLIVVQQPQDPLARCRSSCGRRCVGMRV